MIRVHKCPQAPTSLSTTSAYDGEDVKEQLLSDQHKKCYICELRFGTDFEIEHHKSQKNYPALVRAWENLFMGCSYCNAKKSNSFDDTLYPADSNIEEEIEQGIDFENKKAVFESPCKDLQHQETIELLQRLYNGSYTVRKVREEYFFEQAMSIVNRFMAVVRQYQSNPVAANEKAVKDELSIDQEMLGFKYWIIRRQPALYAVFAQDMVWNR